MSHHYPGLPPAKQTVGEAWSYLLFNTLALESQDPKMQLAILTNAYGAGRVNDALNRFGSVAGQGLPDPVLMVNEALGQSTKSLNAPGAML